MPLDSPGTHKRTRASTSPAATEVRVEQANRLLQSLPADELARLSAELEVIEVTPMQVLAEAGHPLAHVYFPQTAVISLLRRMRDGTTVEAGVIGRDGIAGLTIALGSTWSPETIVASVPGIAQRIPAAAFQDLLPNLPTFSRLIDRYALSFIDQLGQTIACNSLHSIEQRCTRWLLHAHDASGADEFHVTHEVLARMLGVRRAGVTVAALVLQREKLISYTRGRVVILDRKGLEKAGCECYALTRMRTERLLGAEVPRSSAESFPG